MPTRALNRRARTLSLCALVVLAGGCAAKQPVHSFFDLQKRLRPGTTVSVVDGVGTETKGKVIDISPSALVLDVGGTRRRMEQNSVMRVRRHGDPLWNGLLIGLGVGVSAMLITDPAYERCTNDPRNVCANPHTGERILAVAAMGVAGAGIDGLIRTRNDVYLAPGDRLPTAGVRAVSPGLAGLAFTVSVSSQLTRRTVCDGARSIAQLSDCLNRSSAAPPSTKSPK